MTKKAPSPLETKEEAKTQVWSCSSSDARTRSAGLCEKCRSAFLADPQPSSLPTLEQAGRVLLLFSALSGPATFRRRVTCPRRGD